MRWDYGNDISDNLNAEITIGNANGRAFTGINGDGYPEPDGNALVTNWPGRWAVGSGERGGNWNDDIYDCRVSDRYFASSGIDYRHLKIGFRCVVTEP